MKTGEIVLPVLAGLGAIVITGFLIKIIFFKKKNPLITLKDPKIKYPLKLIDREEVSHDTRRFKFGLATPEHVLGLPVGQHIFLSARINGEVVVRPYTPVSSDETKGYVELIIKVYFKNVHPKFPDGGKMSQFLEAMNVGDEISFRGPTGKLIYENQVFRTQMNKKAEPVIRNPQKVSMIAGGTGITPMLQLINQIISDPNDNKELALLYANQTEKDILCHDELDILAANNPGCLRIWYTVDKASDGWRYSEGFISEEMIREHLFPPSDDNLVLMCGPPPMIQFACNPNLEKIGFIEEAKFIY